MLPSLSTVLELHQAGQLQTAAEMYERLLAGDEDNAEALHLLGVLRHQQGQHQRAVELIGRALAVEPNAAAYHANLAEAYRALSQWERAVGCCRTALRLEPEFADAHNNLGLALQGLHRHAEAVEHFRRALRIQPNMALAHNNLGISLRELRQLDDALKHFRSAVELAPEFAAARTNLGQMLLDRGQPEAALPHCREAVRLQPDLAPLHHNLGNVLRELQQFADARASYLEAIRLDPDLALAHVHLGLVLQQENRFGDALTWLKQAVHLEPKNASFWHYLAQLYSDLEESAEALPCWEHVVKLAPERAAAHVGLGWALQEEQRMTEAGEHYRTALRLQPDYAAAMMNLGGVHEELGELAEAEAAFREAGRLQPAFPIPQARLATLLRGKLPDADRAALEERLADRSLADNQRARLLFGLAHVLDAHGEYSRAADCLRQANSISLEMERRQNRDYVPVEHERFIGGMIQAFGRDFFGAMAGAGLPTRRPVFIFGLPRSGTTLIEQVLASHSRVHGAGELRLGRQSFESLPAILERTAAPLPCVPHLTAAAVRRLAEKHLVALSLHDGGRAERVVDKMPDNYMYLGLLATLFPSAVFIHCRRDLRDVAVSCWMTDFRSIRWAKDPEHIATRFQQYRRVMDHWRAVLPVPIHEVDYENAVADIEGVARSLLEACGLDWEPACLDFHRTRRTVRTASVAQVREPIYRRSVARWKHYERELSGLFEQLPLKSDAPGDE